MMVSPEMRGTRRQERSVKAGDENTGSAEDVPGAPRGQPCPERERERPCARGAGVGDQVFPPDERPRDGKEGLTLRL